MPQLIANPRRGYGLPALEPLPCADASRVAALLAQCPAHAPTPLHDLPALASGLGVARIRVKDERDRMGLGSFKALGAAHAIAREAAACRGDAGWETALQDRVFVTASAGNHGLSVAAGARPFFVRRSCRGLIHLVVRPMHGDRLRPTRLREKGAEVCGWRRITSGRCRGGARTGGARARGLERSLSDKFLAGLNTAPVPGGSGRSN